MRNPPRLAGVNWLQGRPESAPQTDGEPTMHLFQFSKPEHDLLVRRVATGLLDGTLRLTDIEGKTDRQVARMVHHSSAGTVRVGTAAAPV